MTVLSSHRDDWCACGDPKISIRKENNRFLFKHQQIKKKKRGLKGNITCFFYRTFLLSKNEQQRTIKWWGVSYVAQGIPGGGRRRIKEDSKVSSVIFSSFSTIYLAVDYKSLVAISNPMTMLRITKEHDG